MNRIVDVDGRLKVEPSLHADPKHALKSDSHRRRDGAFPVDERIEIRTADAQPIGELPLREMKFRVVDTMPKKKAPIAQSFFIFVWATLVVQGHCQCGALP